VRSLTISTSSENGGLKCSEAPPPKCTKRSAGSIHQIELLHRLPVVGIKLFWKQRNLKEWNLSLPTLKQSRCAIRILVSYQFQLSMWLNAGECRDAYMHPD